MITLSGGGGGGREDARREDTQRGHQRDKSRFCSSSELLGTRWKGDDDLVTSSRDCYFHRWQIYEPRCVYPLSRTRRPSADGWMG